MNECDSPLIDDGLALAIECAGSKAALARIAGVTKGAVQQWRTIPLSRVFDIADRLGVSHVELRPDFFDRQVSLPSSQEHRGAA